MIMASHDPEFYQAPKFSPEYDETRPRQRGCFFYGCVIASVLTVLLLIALGIGAFFAWRFFSSIVQQWTATAPMELPKVPLSDDERIAVKERVASFRKALEEGTAVEPLVLTGDDINALIEENPDFRGKVFARVDGDKLKAQVSIPLDNFEVAPLRGRYLNGEAELKASLSNGVLLVMLESLEVNGKKLPGRFLEEMREQNLAKDAYKDPKSAEMLRRFESLEIKDGKIILKPRLRGNKDPADGDSRSAPPLPPSKPEPPRTDAPVIKAPSGKAEAPAHEGEAPASKAVVPAPKGNVPAVEAELSEPDGPRPKA